MRPHKPRLDDRPSRLTQAPRLPESHNNNFTYHSSSQRFAPYQQPASRPRLQHATTGSTQPSQQNRRTPDMQRSPATWRPVPNSINPQMQGGQSARHHRRDSWVQGEDRQSGPGIRNNTSQFLDRNQLGMREERRLERHLDDNPHRMLEPITIWDCKNKGHAFQAIFFRDQMCEYSAIHPRLLRFLRKATESLTAGMTTRWLSLPRYGLVRASRFTELVIEHEPCNIPATPERFLVLDDDTPWHRPGVYIGQRFLDRYSDGDLPPDIFSDAQTGSQELFQLDPTTVAQGSVDNDNTTFDTTASEIIQSSHFNMSITPSGSSWGMTSTPSQPGQPFPDRWDTYQTPQAGSQLSIRQNALFAPSLGPNHTVAVSTIHDPDLCPHGTWNPGPNLVGQESYLQGQPIHLIDPYLGGTNMTASLSAEQPNPGDDTFNYHPQ